VLVLGGGTTGTLFRNYPGLPELNAIELIPGPSKTSKYVHAESMTTATGNLPSAGPLAFEASDSASDLEPHSGVSNRYRCIRAPAGPPIVATASPPSTSAPSSPSSPLASAPSLSTQAAPPPCTVPFLTNLRNNFHELIVTKLDEVARNAFEAQKPPEEMTPHVEKRVRKSILSCVYGKLSLHFTYRYNCNQGCRSRLTSIRI
jgi:hypothetical protein